MAAQDVVVQVCGRRETVAVRVVSMRDLMAAVQRHFDVKPPLLFTAHGGRMLQDDDSLAEYVATGDPVVVKLTEGVMHDFSRRVDQLRHLQWGFLSDQLAMAKSGDGQKADLSRWRLALEQEQANREQVQHELQRGLDAVNDTLRKERSARDALLQTVEDKIAELELRIDKSAQPHEVTASALQQGITELARSIGEERRHREHGEAMLRQERQELQAEFRSEAANQQESSARLRKEIVQTQANVEGVQNSWRAECLELRQHFSDLRQALAHEQQERAAAEGRSTSAVHQAQRLVAQDAKDRSAELQALMNSVRNMESGVEALKAEMRDAHGNFKEEMQDHGDTAAEDRRLRSEGHAHVGRELERLRRELENEGHERNLVSNAVDRVMMELARRCDEEAKARQGEVERLLRMIAGREQRQTSEIQRAISKQSTMGGGDSPSKQELQHSLREMRQELDETKEEVHGMVQSALRDVQAASAPSQSVRFATDSEGWKEAVTRLREDCKEAMQREVRSRVEREKGLREDLEKRLRDLREGLENHTHELHLEGMGGSTTVTTGVAVPGMQRVATARSLQHSSGTLGSASNLAGLATDRSHRSTGGGGTPTTAGAAFVVESLGPGGEMMQRRPSERSFVSGPLSTTAAPSLPKAGLQGGSSRGYSYPSNLDMVRTMTT